MHRRTTVLEALPQLSHAASAAADVGASHADLRAPVEKLFEQQHRDSVRHVLWARSPLCELRGDWPPMPASQAEVWGSEVWTDLSFSKCQYYLIRFDNERFVTKNSGIVIHLY